MNSHPNPSTYAFSSEFTISSHRTPSLIHLDQVKGHLALLHAFAELRLQVDKASDPKKWDSAYVPKDKEKRWRWFVAMAVERFDIWMHIKRPVLTAEEFIHDYLPPLDVIMVWHAYMLNPTWYAEDLQRNVLPGLQCLPNNAFAVFLERAPTILNAAPSSKRVNDWQKHIGTTFNPVPPFDGRGQTVLTNRSIKCFQCGTSFYASYLTKKGTGYLQTKFSMECPSCISTNTKDTLAIRKLHDDLVLKKSTGGDRSFLAGTLRTPTNARDTEHASRIKINVITSIAPTLQAAIHEYEREDGKSPLEAELRKALLGTDPIQPLHWARMFKSMKQVQQAVRYRSGSSGKKFPERIFSAYADDKPYSVDLVGAVQRQNSFVKKMYDLKWTERDEVPLKHAVARYHAFLDLMSSTPAGFFVPTLDIDLAWHTHQLLGEKYHTDCMTYVGRYVDHDDKVEEHRLSSAFELTCRAWQQRFHIRYTHCGCGETIGQQLTCIISSKSESITANHLHPPKYHDLLAATHPSAHNAVFDVCSTNTVLRRRWEMKVKRTPESKQKERKRGCHGPA